MEIARERISFTLNLRDILLSLQTGFSFVRAVVACAILERISGFAMSQGFPERVVANSSVVPR